MMSLARWRAKVPIMSAVVVTMSSEQNPRRNRRLPLRERLVIDRDAMRQQVPNHGPHAVLDRKEMRHERHGDAHKDRQRDIDHHGRRGIVPISRE